MRCDHLLSLVELIGMSVVGSRRQKGAIALLQLVVLREMMTNTCNNTARFAIAKNKFTTTADNISAGSFATASASSTAVKLGVGQSSVSVNILSWGIVATRAKAAVELCPIY